MPSLATPPSRAPQLDALTGLRFLAAAAVFVSHTKGWFAIENFHPGPIGSAAVGFFFVLSGFILSHVYRGASEATSAGRFYLARFARIWPMHIACLALVCRSWLGQCLRECPPPFGLLLYFAPAFTLPWPSAGTLGLLSLL